jgi:hypothetical protein
MPIPKVRDELFAVSQELHKRDMPELARRVAFLANATKRRPACRRARGRHVPITAAMMKDIRRMARDCPDMPEETIARHFGIKGGRVSEVLHGYADGSLFVPDPG